MKKFIENIFKTIAIIIVIVLISIIIDQIYSQKNMQYNINLCNKYKTKIQYYENKELTLKNMAKTMIIAYNISEWEAKYYSIIFKDFADQYNIPWEIYPAMIRIESNFRTTLKSDKSAKGITQILEPTTKTICEKLNIKYIENETVWNDLLNLIIGIDFLSESISSPTVNDSTIQHGIKSYLGGADYLKKIKYVDYIGNYSSTVWDEYNKLIYIYKGVCSENINTR